MGIEHQLLRGNLGNIKLQNHGLQIGHQRIFFRQIHINQAVKPCIPVVYNHKQGNRCQGRFGQRQVNFPHGHKPVCPIHQSRFLNGLGKSSEKVHHDEHAEHRQGLRQNQCHKGIDHMHFAHHKICGDEPSVKYHCYQEKPGIVFSAPEDSGIILGQGISHKDNQYQVYDPAQHHSCYGNPKGLEILFIRKYVFICRRIEAFGPECYRIGIHHGSCAEGNGKQIDQRQQTGKA